MSDIEFSHDELSRAVGREMSAAEKIDICRKLIAKAGSMDCDGPVLSLVNGLLSILESNPGINQDVLSALLSGLVVGLALFADQGTLLSDMSCPVNARRNSGAVLGPVLASCVYGYFSRVIRAYREYTGSHGWLPGDVAYDSSLEYITDVSAKLIRRLGLESGGFVPVILPDEFREMNFGDLRYGREVPGVVLRRAVAASGMSMDDRVSVCGQLMYSLEMSRGGLHKAVLDAFFRTGIESCGEKTGWMTDVVLGSRLRMLAAVLTVAYGRGFEILSRAHEIATLAGTLRYDSIIGPAIDQCAAMAEPGEAGPAAFGFVEPV